MSDLVQQNTISLERIAETLRREMMHWPNVGTVKVGIVGNVDPLVPEPREIQIYVSLRVEGSIDGSISPRKAINFAISELDIAHSAYPVELIKAKLEWVHHKLYAD